MRRGVSERRYRNEGGIMQNKVGIEVSIAVAEAVALANVDVVAAYPIPPVLG